MESLFLCRVGHAKPRKGARHGPQFSTLPSSRRGRARIWRIVKARDISVWQIWEIFRWSRITLVVERASRLMRVKVRMLSVSVDVLMEKAAIRLEIGHTSLLKFWSETDCCREFCFCRRELQFVWHIFLGVMIVDLKSEIERFLIEVESCIFRAQFQTKRCSSRPHWFAIYCAFGV